MTRDQHFFAALIIVSACHVAFGAPPSLFDERLELKLFATDPDIVTPIGMAIDSKDRIYVIESHTHLPPVGYAGPKGDIIKGFVDSDNDGSPDRQWNFATNVQEAMNLALAPDGQLFAVCARDVWAFNDNDGDGVSEGRRSVLHIETSNKYPHSCQLGITFSRDGWMYVSRGNNGSAAYTIHGTDASQLSGYGDGGNIYRCRPDGSKLEQVATGFWNPFDLKFDSYGRLLAVDNDPDARGPNRLLHVVAHGDYGYRSIYGGGGNHPFQGWDGTLPGTLGYVDGTGEAPSGLIDANRTSFPANYRDHYLVTIWNENSIARYVPSSNGVSIKATHSVWMQGDQDFRPVALDCDSHGNLFITDWALVAYPNHGRGRIWRISVKTGVATAIPRLQPRDYFAATLPNPGAVEFDKVMSLQEPSDAGRLDQTLTSDDAFLRHAAVVALSRPAFRSSALHALQHATPCVRLGGLLALKRANVVKPEPYVRRLLGDPDENVRRAALIWAGEAGLLSLRSDLDQAIAFNEVSAQLFETWLAAVESLDPAFVKARANKENDKADRLKRQLDPAVLMNVITDEKRPDRVRALALIHLKNPKEEKAVRFIRILAESSTPVLRREAIRSLSETTADVSSLFLGIATDDRQPADIRAEALLGLSRTTVADPTVLLPLLVDPSETVRLETLRALRTHAAHELVKRALWKRSGSLENNSNNAATIQQLEYILFPPGSEADRKIKRPDTLEDWTAALSNGGNPAAGERLFFAPQTQCSGCHLMHNRGRRIGPELSNIGQSVSREQIIRSILRPSEQYPPQFQAWFVELKDGEYFQGLQLDHKDNGGIELYTTEGITRSFKGPAIATYGVLQRSLMPDGLENTMTVAELRDLVAFLESLK